jgi:hypothetical protein
MRIATILLAITVFCAGGAVAACETSDDCTSHEQCGAGELCQFGSGRCLEACAADEDCRRQERCNPCGTAMCLTCMACLAACVPENEL